jgi:hypothetical protein
MKFKRYSLSKDFIGNGQATLGQSSLDRSRRGNPGAAGAKPLGAGVGSEG